MYIPTCIRMYLQQTVVLVWVGLNRLDLSLSRMLETNLHCYWLVIGLGVHVSDPYICQMGQCYIITIDRPFDRETYIHSHRRAHRHYPYHNFPYSSHHPRRSVRLMPDGWLNTNHVWKSSFIGWRRWQRLTLLSSPFVFSTWDDKKTHIHCMADYFRMRARAELKGGRPGRSLTWKLLPKIY